MLDLHKSLHAKRYNEFLFMPNLQFCELTKPFNLILCTSTLP